MGTIGLVLEGGGMRGAYTAGVLDALLEKDIEFPYVIGVSAGANNGANFVARQQKRGKRLFVDYIDDDRYMGVKNLIKEKSYFGMDFLFDVLPNEIDPFDYSQFDQSNTNFKVVLTDCENGQPTYVDYDNYDPYYFVDKILRASCSLPLISPPVEIQDKHYLDGGIADPIPIKKSIADGNPYNVVILTRDLNYRKTPIQFKSLIKLFLKKYPKLVNVLEKRYKIYNRTLNYIETLEDHDEVFVIRPQTTLAVDRFEKDRKKLEALYHQGYSEMKEEFINLRTWVQKINENNE